MSALSQSEAGILLWIQTHLRGGMDGVMLFITALADYGAFWLALTALLLVIRKTRARALGPAFSLALGFAACNLLLKPLIQRPRPYLSFDFLVPLGRLEKDTSFPSGHACASFACAAAVAAMYGKKAGIPALILAALISLSRLYVGVHYPSDVLAGALLGTLCGLVGAWLARRVTAKKNNGNGSSGRGDRTAVFCRFRHDLPLRRFPKKRAKCALLLYFNAVKYNCWRFLHILFVSEENRMNKHNKKPHSEAMYEAILTLRTVDECMAFFSDLCTVTELQAMEQRYQVAVLLNKGLIYNDILEQTGASSATISRVNRSLQYGADGYQIAFDRLKAGEDADK